MVRPIPRGAPFPIPRPDSVYCPAGGISGNHPRTAAFDPIHQRMAPLPVRQRQPCYQTGALRILGIVRGRTNRPSPIVLSEAGQRTIVFFLHQIILTTGKGGATAPAGQKQGEIRRRPQTPCMLRAAQRPTRKRRRPPGGRGRVGCLSTPTVNGGQKKQNAPEGACFRCSGGHAGIRTLDPGFARMHP